MAWVFAVPFGGFLDIQGCNNSSNAEGLASWSNSNVSCKKSWASAEMSDGIVGFADEPICGSVIREINVGVKTDILKYLEDSLHLS